MNRQRHASILIIVAGLAAILLVLVVGLISRAREEARASAVVMQEAQARLMLHAACQYVLEASRLGYDAVPLPGGHPQSDPPVADAIVAREAFGWTDIRGPLADPVSGSVDAVGPKDQFGYRLYDPTPIDPTDPSDYLSRWPAPGAVARCPLYRKRLPPFAVSGSQITNPVVFERGGLPYTRWAEFTRPWPQQVRPNWSDYARGDSSAVPESLGLSWFRVYREVEQDHNGLDDPAYAYDDDPEVDTVDFSGHHGIFVLTCGAGPTEGFRDWAEVVAAGAQAQFGSPADFLALQETEVRLWYRVEYSAAVGTDEKLYVSHDAGGIGVSGNGTDIPVTRWNDDWRKRFDKEDSLNPLIWGIEGTDYLRHTRRSFNPLGTILWIQRLDQEPARW
jgi:type II secretory pathway pseudopilin PulG